MNSTLQGLLEYTRSRVTERDIVDFSPSDPGYGGYVRRWTKILHSGEVPCEAEFDLSEVISLTSYGIPDHYDEPERFRHYRRLTTAVAMALLQAGQSSDTVCFPNRIARTLILDADLSSKKYMEFLLGAIAGTKGMLKKCSMENQYPYFTLASLILAQRMNDWPAAEKAATKLIEDEKSIRERAYANYGIVDDKFLLGSSIYYAVDEEWAELVIELKNPSGHGDTQFVIDSLEHSLCS